MTNQEKIAKIRHFMVVNPYTKVFPIFNNIIWYLQSDDLDSAQDKFLFDNDKFWDNPHVISFLDGLDLISDRYKSLIKF